MLGVPLRGELVFLADAVSPRVSVHTLLTGLQTGSLSLIALAIEVSFCGWYGWSSRRLSQRGRRWSRWRTASFMTGMGLVVIAV